jgi:hypothetical protein
VVFIHIRLDELGLTPEEFRIYCHLARRAGKKMAWPSVGKISEDCMIGHNMVRTALQSLAAAQLITIEIIPGGSNHYRLTDPEDWKPQALIRPPKKQKQAHTPPEISRGENEHTPTETGRGTPPEIGRTPLPKSGDEIDKGNISNLKSPTETGNSSSAHHEFIKVWCSSYEEAFGRTYMFDGGRDGKAVRELLRTPGLTTETILRVAAKAWRRIDDRFGASKHAQTIYGLRDNWMKIHNEVEPPKKALTVYGDTF